MKMLFQTPLKLAAMAALLAALAVPTATAQRGDRDGPRADRNHRAHVDHGHSPRSDRPRRDRAHHNHGDRPRSHRHDRRGYYDHRRPRYHAHNHRPRYYRPNRYYAHAHRSRYAPLRYHYRPRAYQPRYYAPRAAYAPRYQVGGHYYYGNHSRIIYDYGVYGLYDPPYGYHWVRDNDRGDAILASVATGAIIGLVIGALSY